MLQSPYAHFTSSTYSNLLRSGNPIFHKSRFLVSSPYITHCSVCFLYSPMLRFLRNFKYYAWQEVRRGCSVVAPPDRSDVLLVLPTVWPSELTKRIRPLSVPDLIEKFSCDAPGGQFATMSEYLRSDPRPDGVLLPSPPSTLFIRFPDLGSRRKANPKLVRFLAVDFPSHQAPTSP